MLIKAKKEIDIICKIRRVKTIRKKPIAMRIGTSY
jgi:hypothetical protein